MDTCLSQIAVPLRLPADGSNGTMVRDYTLSYTNSATSGRSLLSSVQVAALNANSKIWESLPATSFKYGSGDAPKLVQKQKFALGVLADGEEIAIKTYIGDFDGSGTSSIVVPVQVCSTPTGCKRRAFNG